MKKLLLALLLITTPAQAEIWIDPNIRNPDIPWPEINLDYINLGDGLRVFQTRSFSPRSLNVYVTDCKRKIFRLLGGTITYIDGSVQMITPDSEDKWYSNWPHYNQYICGS